VKHSVIFSLTLYTALTCAAAVYSEESVITKDGKEVILHPDGRWTYGKNTAGALTKPTAAKKLLKGKTGWYGISMDETKWLQKKPKVDGHEFAIEHVDGDIYGFTLPERVEFPLHRMREIILENLKDGDSFSNVKLLQEDNRIVNGKRFLHLMVDGEFRGAPMVFEYYVYSGSAGTLQTGVLTSHNLYQQYKADILELLNGVEIYK
jgi:hypothetical protein